MIQLDKFCPFKDFDKYSPSPVGYKKIRVSLVYYGKHDGRHKASLVTDGQLSDISFGSFYSGLVSLHGIRLLVFLDDINKMETWNTDIGNSYLEDNTLEKVYIIAGT